MAIDVSPRELHRLSIDEYHRLIGAGGLDEDARIELLDGLLAVISPIGLPSLEIADVLGDADV